MSSYENVPCPVGRCPEPPADEETMEIHYFNEHTDKGDEYCPYRCRVCRRDFVLRRHLKDHFLELHLVRALEQCAKCGITTTSYGMPAHKHACDKTDCTSNANAGLYLCPEARCDRPEHLPTVEHFFQHFMLSHPVEEYVKHQKDESEGSMRPREAHIWLAPSRFREQSSSTDKYPSYWELCAYIHAIEHEGKRWQVSARDFGCVWEPREFWEFYKVRLETQTPLDDRIASLFNKLTDADREEARQRLRNLGVDPGRWEQHSAQQGSKDNSETDLSDVDFGALAIKDRMDLD